MALLPTTNITPTIVGAALGSASRSVGALCNSSAVNKFSKYKPIEFNSSGGLTEANYAAANYGLIVQDLLTPKSEGSWLYNRPSSYGRRLGDFRQYYHQAPVALLQTKGSSISVNRFTGSSYGIGFTIPAAPSGYENYCLNVSNITPVGGDGVLLGHYYLCAAIYSGTTLKGTYYSKESINYSSVNMNGSSISFSSGSGFNSDDPPIENYAAGNYTIYLYITQSKNTIQTRKYWAINYTTSYPRSLSCQVLGLNDVFSIQTIGIKPSPNGVWANSDTGYKLGDIGYQAVGTLARYDICHRITNISSSNAILDKSQVYIFYYKLTTWGVTPARASVVSGSGTVSIPVGQSIDLVTTSIPMMPTYLPSESYVGSLSLVTHLHYGNSDSGEKFDETQPLITLGYNY